MASRLHLSTARTATATERTVTARWRDVAGVSRRSWCRNPTVDRNHVDRVTDERRRTATTVCSHARGLDARLVVDRFCARGRPGRTGAMERIGRSNSKG